MSDLELTPNCIYNPLSTVILRSVLKTNLNASNNNMCNLCLIWKQPSLFFFIKNEPSEQTNPTIQSLKKGKFAYSKGFVGSSCIAGATEGISKYFFIPLLKIYIAKLNCPLRVSVKKKSSWCNIKGNNISCNSDLEKINLTVGLLKLG